MQNSSPCCINSSNSAGFSNATSGRWPRNCCCVGRSGRHNEEEVDATDRFGILARVEAGMEKLKLVVDWVVDIEGSEVGINWMSSVFCAGSPTESKGAPNKQLSGTVIARCCEVWNLSLSINS